MSSKTSSSRKLFEKNNSNLSQKKFQQLSDSILSHLKFNVKKTKEKRQRVDSKATGMVLNEKKVQEILINKKNKKKEILEKQALKAQNSAILAEARVNKALENANKAILKAENAKLRLSVKLSNKENKKPGAKHPQLTSKKITESTILCKECEIRHDDSDQKLFWLRFWLSFWLSEDCENWFCEACKNEALEDYICIYCR